MSNKDTLQLSKCSHTDLNLDVLGDRLTDGLSGRTIKRNTPDSTENEARVILHQVEQTVYELLRPGQQPPQVKVHVPFEYGCDSVVGENADDLVIDVGQLEQKTRNGFVRPRDGNEYHVVTRKEDKLAIAGAYAPDGIHLLLAVLQKLRQRKHRSHQ